mgnify:CR=1 FL=1
MQMPDTDNIDHQHAFKKGYRMAIEGKRVTSMPSNIRRDMGMRDYFQQGWEQAIDDMTIASQEANKPEWRKRFVWFMFMVIGGLATASLMIHDIEERQAEQQALIDNDKKSVQTLPEETKPSKTVAPQTNQDVQSPAEQYSPDLALLSSNQRNDLVLTKQNQTAHTPIALNPIFSSPITVNNAVISESIQDQTPVRILTNDIPKYIRKIYFYTEISHAKGQIIYHRWRTNDQILATIELPITSDNFRTWSSKKLTSAWLGQWYLEVLDSQKNVIYRKTFNYGTKK